MACYVLFLWKGTSFNCELTCFAVENRWANHRKFPPADLLQSSNLVFSSVKIEACLACKAELHRL